MFDVLKKKIKYVRFYSLHRRSLTAIKRYQLKKLNHLISNSRTHVPLYQRLYRSIQKDMQLASLDEVSLLPTTNKALFRDLPVEEYLDGSTGGGLYWHATSGTSGEPFFLVRGPKPVEPYYPDFYSLRFLHWKGTPIRKFAEIKTARIKVREKPMPNRLFVSVSEFLRDPFLSVKKIKLFEPLVVVSYGAILLELAKVVKTFPPTSRLEVPYAVSMGEMITPAARHEIETALGCEVYDQYGMEEIGSIGVECSAHDGFHLHSETVYAEIVDESGCVVPPGETGRVLLTNMLNTRMPFIRYETGDSGRITEEKCICGLSSPRLWIEGRYAAYLTFGKKKIHHLEFDAQLDTFSRAIIKYQVSKKTETRVVVRIVPSQGLDEGMKSDIVASIRTLLPDAEVVVEIVASIPTTGAGKSKIVTDESVTV